MFRNHLKLVFRRLRKERLFTFVNIFGLTIGLTAFLLIALYVRDELSYDKFHEDVDDIYRLVSYDEKRDVHWGGAVSDFIEYIVDDIPEIDSYARIHTSRTPDLVSAQNSGLYTDQMIFTDSAFFTLFDFELIDGVNDFVLSKTRNVVLTESFAKRLFGRLDVVGEELTLNKKEKYYVSGICRDVPKNSTIQFELVALADQDMFAISYLNDWVLHGAELFLKLPEGMNTSLIEETINNETRQKPNYFIVKGDTYFSLSPLKDQRLFSNLESENLNTNDAKYVFLFSGIAIIILLLAVINYVNLVTAQSIRRIKEIGVRKVIGAKKIQLFQYQMLESILVTLISFVFSFAIAERVMPRFNEVLGKQIVLNYFGVDFFVWVLVSGVLLGLFAGLYPSYCITRVRALSLVRASAKTIGGKGFLRRTLVLFQFVVSGILICVLVIMSKQMSFLNQNSLGFEKDYLISIPLFEDSLSSPETMKSEIANIKGVESVSFNTWRFGGATSTGRYDRKPIKGGDFIAAWPDLVMADKNFIETMKLELLEVSTNFSGDQLLDNQVIVNQSLINKFGWQGDAIGKLIYTGFANNFKELEIVGVIKDFHTYSMKKEITPLVIENFSFKSAGNLLLRIQATNTKQILNEVAESYQSITERPFDFYYLDDRIESYYKQEQGQFRLFQIFSSLAIFISLLGLVALTIYMVELRRKEVSIRKVLGASVQRLILMLNREYTILVVVAFLIASPIAYYAMQDWLAAFKYRIEISPMLFVGGFLGFLALCWMVSVFQSLKVSGENPADVLREE